MELITGHAGENHISSDDDAAKYAALIGSNAYVLESVKLVFYKQEFHSKQGSLKTFNFELSSC